MQIKVKDTRMHKVYHAPNAMGVGKIEYEVPVAEAKLVLVECRALDSLLWLNNGKYGLSPHYTRDIKNKYYKPVLISETEKIEKGDLVLYKGKILKVEKTDWAGAFTLPYTPMSQGGCYFHFKELKKILALPEHFSPKHLQAIVYGKLKDGDKVLVECEVYLSRSRAIKPSEYIRGGGGTPHYEYTHVKLNSSNHITLYREEVKTYTQEQVDEMLDRQTCETTAQVLKNRDSLIYKAWCANYTGQHFEEDFNAWFNENIK